MSNVKFYLGEDIPLELHKVRMVQKLYLVPIERRLEAIKDAGFNTFRLSTKDVYLDMLTDSGTNAMSDNQISAMLRADDAYAGSQSFERLQEAVEEVLGKKYLLPVHQGRAAENVISRTFIKPGNVIPMNYHFTTALAHILENGGKVAELLHDEALILHSENPFKGNMDIAKLEACIQENGVENIPFIRMEASTNLIGGQPFSISNLMDVRRVADKYGMDLDTVKKYLRPEEVKEQVIREKVIKVVADSAKAVAPAEEKAELEAEGEIVEKPAKKPAAKKTTKKAEGEEKAEKAPAKKPAAKKTAKKDAE